MHICVLCVYLCFLLLNAIYILVLWETNRGPSELQILKASKGTMDTFDYQTEVVLSVQTECESSSPSLRVPPNVLHSWVLSHPEPQFPPLHGGSNNPNQNG